MALIKVIMGSFFDKVSRKSLKMGETFIGDVALLERHTNLELVDAAVAAPSTPAPRVVGKATVEDPEEVVEEEEDEDDSDSDEDADEDEDDEESDTYTQEELIAFTKKYKKTQLVSKAKAAKIKYAKDTTELDLVIALLRAGVEL